MSNNRQNNGIFSEDYFSKLDEWHRSEETKERTKVKITQTIRRQKASYRPYIATAVSLALFGMLMLSVLPAVFEHHLKNEVIVVEGDNIQEFYRPNYKNENIWIATINVLPIEVSYPQYNQREYGEVLIYYKKMGDDILNMAFHHQGETYTIMYKLANERDLEKAFLLAEEQIDELKSKGER